MKIPGSCSVSDNFKKKKKRRVDEHTDAHTHTHAKASQTRHTLMILLINPLLLEKMICVFRKEKKIRRKEENLIPTAERGVKQY